MLGLDFSFLVGFGFCIISIAKNLSKKVGALISFTRFLSSEVVLYLYKSTT